MLQQVKSAWKDLEFEKQNKLLGNFAWTALVYTILGYIIIFDWSNAVNQAAQTSKAMTMIELTRSVKILTLGFAALVLVTAGHLMAKWKPGHFAGKIIIREIRLRLK